MRKKIPQKINFYLSQLRIRIEQTFGLMTGKWRILHQPLQMKLKNPAKVFMCITRLHNFASMRAIFLSTIVKIVKSVHALEC